MTLRTVSDELLARRARAGDDAAFAEFARRHASLIGYMSRWAPPGLAREDMRQEALIGLFDACRAFDPARGSLGTIVGLCVRHRIAYAHRAATALKRTIVSDAVGLDHPVSADAGELTIADCVAAPDGTDPARVVELRDELRERARPKPRRVPRPTALQRRPGRARARARGRRQVAQPGRQSRRRRPYHGHAMEAPSRLTALTEAPARTVLDPRRSRRYLPLSAQPAG